MENWNATLHRTQSRWPQINRNITKTGRVHCSPQVRCNLVFRKTFWSSCRRRCLLCTSRNLQSLCVPLNLTSHCPALNPWKQKILISSSLSLFAWRQRTQCREHDATEQDISRFKSLSAGIHAVSECLARSFQATQDRSGNKWCRHDTWQQISLHLSFVWGSEPKNHISRWQRKTYLYTTPFVCK